MEAREWKKVIREFPTLEEDLEGVESLIEHFEGEYFEALQMARDEDARDHVWVAFWNFLIARPTMRKPFQLTSQDADELIARLQSVLDQADSD